jgi:hypothetical protein
MHMYDPEGFDSCEPTAKKIHHHLIVSLGLNAEWSGHGHDKLNKISFPLYGIQDVAMVAYLYLSLVEELGG